MILSITIAVSLPDLRGEETRFPLPGEKGKGREITELLEILRMRSERGGSFEVVQLTIKL